MRLDDVRIALRLRTPWEAVDLGMRLVRAHAAAIWIPWFAVTAPLFAAVNALAWLADAPWAAGLAFWWLKPAFDRVPLFVLSRGVFGAAPGWRDTLRMQGRWGWRALLPLLLWRRFDPARGFNLPVDLLEGGDRKRRAERRRVLRRAVAGQASTLTMILATFESILFLSAWVLALMFVPTEFLGESARALWSTFFQSPPPWAYVVANGVYWLAMSAIEPFYVGAGFALYLNRRIHIEAWDLELVFRRLAVRIAQAASASGALATVLLCLGLACAPAIGRAEHRPAPTSLEALYGTDLRTDDKRFGEAVRRAYRDPQLGERKRVTTWRPKVRARDDAKAQPAWLAIVAEVFAALGKYGLWVLAMIVVVYLILHRAQWLPWTRARLTRRRDGAVRESPAPAIAALPADIGGAVRSLWHDGRRRDALALLYRACVQGLARRLGTPLPPGATEAQCLRRARSLDRESEQGLREIVHAWQYAAYADRLPSEAELEILLGHWSRHFGDAA